MPLTTDMMGREVLIPDAPQRILSLVPSQTELLCDLGLADRICGVTKFCIHPTEIRKKAIISGGTKTIRWERLTAIAPDLVIGNMEENEREMIQRLSAEYPVWMSDVRTLDHALEMIRRIGSITGQGERAEILATDIDSSFRKLASRERKEIHSVLYLIWRDPWMAAASDTFIHDMVQRCGFSNCLENLTRYPILNDDLLHTLDPDWVFLSSEPFPFRNEHLQEVAELFPKASVRLVDGEPFSWYGSRLLMAPSYFEELKFTPA